MNDLFSFRDTLSYSDNKKTVRYGAETIACRGPQIWNLVPESIRDA